MRQALVAFVIVLLALVSTPLAAKRVELPLPPEVISRSPYPAWFQEKMQSFRSESLWVEAATERYPERYRMTYFGILIDSLQIQIDRNLDGTARLTAQVHRRKRLIEEKQVRLSKREFADFKAVAEDSGLWNQYPEFWVLTDKDEICLDGMEALLERRDSHGYRFSNGNTSCTAPPGMGRLAEKMITLTRLETHTKWLPWQQ
jgi:hypothetical protein